MISCEYRCGRMEIETIGGFEQTVPAHATVIMSGLSPFRAQLTITAGTGYSMLPPLQTCLLPGACLPGCFDLLPDASLPGCSGFLPDASLPGCFGFLPDFFPDFAKICPDSPPASLPDCFFARLPEYSALLSFFCFINPLPEGSSYVVVFVQLRHNHRDNLLLAGYNSRHLRNMILNRHPEG